MSEEAVRELLNEVINVAEKMAVQIEELYEASAEAGSPLYDLKEVFDEWGEVYRKTGKDFAADGKIPAGLASLGLVD